MFARHKINSGNAPVSTCNNKLLWVNFYTYQFIGTHTNQLDPNLVEISQNNKFCLELFGGLEMIAFYFLMNGPVECLKNYLVWMSIIDHRSHFLVHKMSGKK